MVRHIVSRRENIPAKGRWFFLEPPKNLQIPTGSGKVSQNETEGGGKWVKMSQLLYSQEGISIEGILRQFAVEGFAADTQSLSGFLAIAIEEIQDLEDMVLLDRFQG